MSSNEDTTSPLPGIIARLCGLWILVGALFKLFLGTPNDLPQVVRDFPLELGLTYNLAISIELAIAFTALLRPRWSWLFLVAIYVVFDVVLAMQMSAGDANCGCFGSKITMPPWVMLTIDSILLLALLASRPWKKMSRKGAPMVVVVGAVALGIAAPWLLDRQVTEDGGGGGARSWMELDIASWVGKDVWDTPLGQPPLNEHITVEELPLDAIWVFYRHTCEHCAEHLAEMARTQTGETLIALIRIQEPHDTEANRVVQEMPSGNFVQHAELSDGFDYVIQTPAELRVEGGRVVEAVEAVSAENTLFR